MRNVFYLLFLTLFVSNATFASFPVNNVPVNSNSIESVEEISSATISDEDVETSADDTTIAIILAVVSVLFLPFGLHNWYLGRKKQALWQTLLVIPGFILVVPPLISWIWQIIDLIKLLMDGSL